MRKNVIVLVFASLVITGLLSASSNYLIPQQEEKKSKEPYRALWEQVHDFENTGKIRSALEIADKIYEQAKSDNNPDQMIKALLHRIQFRQEFEEGAIGKLILETEQEAKQQTFPANALLHSILAQMYWEYYQDYRWKIRNRTAARNFKNDDIKTWDAGKFIDKVIHHYHVSLQAKEKLQHTSTKVFPEMINEGAKDHDLLPTLYDFLAYRAVEFFVNEQISLSRPADQFLLNDDFYFAKASEFARQNIHTRDTFSLHFHGIKIMQDVLAFRAEQDNIPAFIDADLRRLKFVKTHSVHPGRDSLYPGALTRLQKQFNNHPYSGMVTYEMAHFHYEQGDKYQSGNPTTEQYKWAFKKAIQLCKKTIQTYSDSRGADKCRWLKDKISKPALKTIAEQEIPSQSPFLQKITYKNLDRVYFQIARIKRDDLEEITKNDYANEKKRYEKLYQASEKIRFDSVLLPGFGDYRKHEVENIIKGLSVGHYMIINATTPEFTYKENMLSFQIITVTNLSYIQRRNDDGSYSVCVVHRKTGVSVKGAHVQPYIMRYNQGTRMYEHVKSPVLTSGQDGFFTLKPHEGEKYGSYTFDLSYQDDFLSTDNRYYVRQMHRKSRMNYRTTLFTDRAIYRPGQTVYFKGIVINTDGKTHEIVPNLAENVALYDANRQEVKHMDVTTNEYGTFSGVFQIPTGLLNGRFQLKSEHGNTSIRVEEYKRPSFEVTILPFKGYYRLNDTVDVQGKAQTFSGANLTGAKVDYRVVRKPIWHGWGPFYFDMTATVITNGTITTNENGKFTIPFKAVPDLTLPRDDQLFFQYEISIDVTDISGETQDTKKNMTIGYTVLEAGLSIPEQVNQENPPFGKGKKGIEIITKNLNGEFVPAKGSITIHALKENEMPLVERKWNMPDTFIYSREQWEKRNPGHVYADEQNIRSLEKEHKIFEEPFNTEKNNYLNIKQFGKWETGRYVAEIKSVDAFGNDVMNKTYFTVYNPRQKQVPYPVTDWFTPLKHHCEPGEIARFLIGSALEDVSMLYEIEHENKIVHQEWLTLNSEQKIIEIPVKEKHRGNFAVHFVFVKNNMLYNHDEIIHVPYTNKKLDISFATFRDKLYPGQQEEWQINIKGHESKKIAAEMMATLYDASLDQFAENRWNFNIYKHYYSHLKWKSPVFATLRSTNLSERFYDDYYYSESHYPSLRWFGLNFYEIRRTPVTAQYMRASKSANKKSEAQLEQVAIVENDAVISEEIDADVSEQAVTDKKGHKKQNIQIRTNFNETAFFYPHLTSNADGEVTIRFTIPEALTRWRMMGFAHTKDLEYGTIENELITRKELMVSPNAPRFFRKGDTIDFPVKVMNISKKDLAGQVTLELLDAFTNTTVSGILRDTSEKPFDVSAGKNDVVSFRMVIPDDMNMITYKVIARAGKFSDGEQKPVPVLTNRMLVTESLPLAVRGCKTKTFTLDKLTQSGSSATLKHHQLTLEYTSNPSWYAIQALPYLMEYPYDCTEQIFSRYYANVIASHIVNAHPRIKQVFERWRTDSQSNELVSTLEKNQELKSLLLEETPWVLDAESETARKKRVALLFDLNRMHNELNSTMLKLQKAQSSNGGFPWFKGMRDNRYITQHIVNGMGHLDHLAIMQLNENQETWGMFTKAVHYCDQRILEDYRQLQEDYSKTQMQEDHLSHIAIHYLYGRSFFPGIPVADKCNEAYEYYMEQAKKFWTGRNIYDKGMIALILHREGDQKTSKTIVESLKEYAIVDEEMGMYWKTNKRGYYWYQAPIETQALMVEVFSEVTADEKAVENIKIWLIKQKQTNDWGTTKATVEACYALLMQGGDWLVDDELADIRIGQKQINPQEMDDVKVEAGTGYFKTSWNTKEIIPEMGEVTVNQKNKGIGWGALYWQYFEDMDKITSHETPLQLNKKLFIEKTTSSGNVIEPMGEKRPVNVGDKIIVRIELRVDRDMEFVHMKDMRASGVEAVNVMSTYKWQDGLGYYESTKDAATHFFMDYLPKGTYVFEYPLRATHKGNFSNGITTIQCMYAPEFTSHSEGIRVVIE